MKKTNRLFIISAALVSLALGACNKDLNLTPPSNTIVGNDGQGTAGSYIKDATTAEAALNSCYAFFRSGSSEYYVLDYFNIGDAQSDNAYAGADNAAGFEIDEFRLLSTNAWASRDWGYLYNQITACNAVIANVPKVTDPALTANRKAQIVGEAQFIRARAYFDLVRIFGDLPLVLTELPTITADNLEEIYPLLYPARKSADSVYAQIDADLKAAAEVVPVSAANKGFVTKGAVYTLLAKVAATHKPINWAQVENYTNQVTALGYTLLPVYDHLWDGAHENSAEAIFELNFAGWDTGGNWGTSMFLGTDWKKFCNPSNDLIRAYQYEKDTVRFKSTITFANVNGKWGDARLSLDSFPFFYKMRKTDATQNIIMYRLADVLLLKAEALNEQGNVGAANTIVTQIRERAHLKPLEITDQAAMRLAIEKERRLELAFEGIRWHDLVRTDRAIPVMQAVTDGKGVNLGYRLTPESLLWPIPQSEMDQNANLVQNEGY
ncbi:RagB/SusD family nutrient uptake outer membrane protein [Chitinophaga rhizophila]|uniref:RagB/SusD family nutrient uptake outer membrane protein n=1 Tax=Chitinophaga rhizophila TaxID=2866212 RepID=A0ABS7GLW9_9BACT|nr:RagB/SusD family nutrient uptake outer membrane protein [Chitinophaga rhizophila]MBW8688290.1 RagB/SusD family nutrient uptake outer membrane protein [Chitinophaga rhizophila]